MNVIISLFLVFLYCSSHSLIAMHDNDILAAIGEVQSETYFAGFDTLTQELTKLENDLNNQPKEVAEQSVYKRKFKFKEDELKEKIKQCDYILSGALCNKDRKELRANASNLT